jgi:type I restriction enzyme M protein
MALSRKPEQTKDKDNGVKLGFKAKLWAAADKCRNDMDAAEYKHVVLGLIFLQYISDAFEGRRGYLQRDARDSKNWLVKDPEGRYETLEYRDVQQAENIFWVPKKARWAHLKTQAKRLTIVRLVDDAMANFVLANGSMPSNQSTKGEIRPDLLRSSTAATVTWRGAFT